MTAAGARVLVLGGQRSGKSRYAERLVVASGRACVYLATATAGDGEMAARIALHRERRGTEVWRTVEEPLELPDALVRESGEGNAILIECLTLWLANVLAAGRSAEAEGKRLTEALDAAAGIVVAVSNEVGSGIVPDNALARHYADALGSLNQRVAEAADHVVLVSAGLPLVLKPMQKQNEVVL